MNDEILTGFYGIPFGMPKNEALEVIKKWDTIYEDENSSENNPLYRGFRYEGHAADMLRLIFINGRFAGATLYFTPHIETAVLVLYELICKTINTKYYTTDRIIQRAPGSPYNAIKSGTAEFSSIWYFKSNNCISVNVNRYFDVELAYTSGNASKNSLLKQIFGFKLKS